MGRLPHRVDFTRYTVLDLNDQGRLVDPATRRSVSDEQVAHFLERILGIDDDVSDIFVWVHGWRTDRRSATTAAARLFHGIEAVYGAQPARYPRIRDFKGAYIAVCWPSRSSPLPWGYAKIRDRAHAMTECGYAAHFLAALLGYLDEQRHGPGVAPGTLRTATGQYLHCVGHSFGGRFLAQAIAAAATPRPPTLPLLERPEAFRFTVDNFLAFQMAAEPGIFSQRLEPLLRREVPLQGPICLTYSSVDWANCLWHRFGEGCRGVGCRGAKAPPEYLKTVSLRPLESDYSTAELSARVVNVDASWLYRQPLVSPQGAHSDFWYEESMHLLLTLVNFAR